MKLGITPEEITLPGITPEGIILLGITILYITLLGITLHRTTLLCITLLGINSKDHFSEDYSTRDLFCGSLYFVSLY